MTQNGIPTPSPTFAPVLSPEELESCCVLPPNDGLFPVGEVVTMASVAVRPCDIVLRYVLVGDVDVDWVLTLLLKLAVAYTTGSGALNVKSSMVQHVKLVSASLGQSLRLPPTYAQQYDSLSKHLNSRPVFLVGSRTFSYGDSDITYL
jgi:hypothetical protein